MGLSITLKMDTHQRRQAARVAFFADLRPYMTRVGARLQRDIVATFRTQKDPKTGASWRKTSDFTLGLRPGGGRGGRTLQASNRLQRSLTSRPARARGTAKNPSLKFGTGSVKYAATHQQSFTNSGRAWTEIRPTNAKNLALPLTRQARLAPSARVWWERNKARRPFVFTSKKGNLLIAVSNKRGGLTPHFLLKERVLIPQRRFLGYGRVQSLIVTNQFKAEMNAINRLQ